MKLRKTWMGICVWLIYFVGMIAMIGVTSFFSGPFTVCGKYTETAFLVVISIVLSLILAFIGCKAGLGLRENGSLFSTESKHIPFRIIFPAAVIIGAIFAYPVFMRLTNLRGNLGLVVAASVSEEDIAIGVGSLLEKIYVTKLNVLMSFLGNDAQSSIVFQTILRILLALMVYFALNRCAGILAGVAAYIFMVSVPVFGYSINDISEYNLYYVFLWTTILVLIFWARGFETSAGKKPYYVIFDLIAGALLGFVIFLDPGSVAAVVFPIAALFIRDEIVSLRFKLGNLIFLLIAACATFGLLLVVYTGSKDVIYAFWQWFESYYGAFASQWIPMVERSFENQILSLVTLGVAGTSIFAYFFSGRNERILPLLVFSIVSVALSIVLNGTMLDNELYLFTVAAVLIGCVFSCFAYDPDAEELEMEEAIEKDKAAAKEAKAKDKAAAEEPEADDKVSIEESKAEGKAVIAESEVKNEAAVEESGAEDKSANEVVDYADETEIKADEVVDSQIDQEALINNSANEEDNTDTVDSTENEDKTADQINSEEIEDKPEEDKCDENKEENTADEIEDSANDTAENVTENVEERTSEDSTENPEEGITESSTDNIKKNSTDCSTENIEESTAEVISENIEESTTEGGADRIEESTAENYTVNNEENTVNTEEIEKTEIKDEEVIADENSQQEDESDASYKTTEKVRYVPEGMVLPTGEEDEEDLEPHFNTNRAMMDDIGILSVGKPSDKKADGTAEDKGEEKAEEKAEEKTEDIVNHNSDADNENMEVESDKAVTTEEAEESSTEDNSGVSKDEFDLAFKPGDDFDI